MFFSFQCWDAGNRWALEQAKHNLVNKYFLVGVTEDLESFIQILEQTLPTFFKGASQMFRDSGQQKHIRKTKHKDLPSDETISAFEDTKVWKLEQEFYEFALAHFNWIKHEMALTKGETKFHYEKIRPETKRDSTLSRKEKSGS